MHSFWSGFEKKSSRAANAITGLAALGGALGGGLSGSGAGFLARARYEPKVKPDSEKTTKELLLGKAPVLGLTAGAGLGALLSALSARSVLKMAALRPDVALREHQVDAIKKLQENNGSLLVAHATGSGKTLTGIAGFEQLKADGKAKRAVVVVPASLRENFVKNLKQFTNSSSAVYGPKGESKTKSIGDKSTADYNVISYELFREHGDKVLEDTGADTLIMDEIHRVRGTEGSTYNKIRDLRPKVKNAITLTGSVVNNEPSDVVPLLDITYSPTGHKLVDRKFFDKLFVNKQMQTKGFWKPKSVVTKALKNKTQLAKYLENKIDFISHKDLEKDMPDKKVETHLIPMSQKQQTIYNFTMSSVDPITRWKIRNNLPVGQHEAQQAFGKLMQARQVSTDPSVMDKTLQDKDPAEYSPKIKKVLEDLSQHLDEKPHHKTVVFGNLIQGQVSPIERALKARGIGFSKFVGLGNEGVTAKTRPEALKEFQSGKNRVLLISGAGAEGLDLKDATMLQMLEGHYNPERVQQAEARVRRMGGLAHLPEAERQIQIKRYLSVPKPGGISKVLRAMGLGGGNTGVDEWVYNIATRKDSLNEEFRDVLKKTASLPLGYLAGRTVGGALAGIPARVIAKRRDADVEGALKQMLLDRGMENLTQKRHYDKVLAESKVDERMLDAGLGAELLMMGLPVLAVTNPAVISKMKNNPIARKLMGSLAESSLTSGAAIGTAVGLGSPILRELAQTHIMRAIAKGGKKDLETGVDKYIAKLRRKAERKYIGSKDFVRSYETKEDLGIDQVAGM